MEKFLVPVKPLIDPPRPVKRWQLHHNTLSFSNFTDSELRECIKSFYPNLNFDFKVPVEEEHDRTGRSVGAEVPT